VLAADSPRLLSRLFETYEEVGLRRIVADYLGERPVLSANKCTLRRVPLTANTDWHQDGAFLGRGIRALNIWIALSHCGVDSPGMDLLPRRLDHIVETGTGGAIFDWAVGRAVVAQLAVDAPVVRPEFEPGDALLFDDMFLHRTAIEPTMTRPRYAVESWFFAPTSYPEGQVPLVW
jgi:ectoine hydroxylase-related dioxygenase (phytanoyl-CoA dioxygenase family)